MLECHGSVEKPSGKMLRRAEISGSLEDGISRNFARGRLRLSEKPGKRMNLLEIQEEMYAQYSVLL